MTLCIRDLTLIGTFLCGKNDFEKIEFNERFGECFFPTTRTIFLKVSQSNFMTLKDFKQYSILPLPIRYFSCT